MKLLLQPDDGTVPVVKAINKAKKTIEIVIFRFDQREIELALANAVLRGVAVHALIAHTNRQGAENLRKLELRLLAAGVTVARTANDLVRYHAKYMLIDRRELYLFAFNLTHLDMERSRSFGLIICNRSLVAEAAKLFEADMQRHAYEAGAENFVVSPVNARRRLAGLIKSARRELDIYDIKVSDKAMIRLLEERARAGVKIRIIGRLVHKITGVAVRKLNHIRLHTRTIAADGRVGFIGSQSLRGNELDQRREVGVIFRDIKIVSQILKTFEADWQRIGDAPQERTLDDRPVAKAAKKVAKVVTRELPEVLPVLNGAVKQVVGDKTALKPDEIVDTVKNAVRDAVEEALRNVVEEVVEQSGGTPDKPV